MIGNPALYAVEWPEAGKGNTRKGAEQETVPKF